LGFSGGKIRLWAKLFAAFVAGRRVVYLIGGVCLLDKGASPFTVPSKPAGGAFELGYPDSSVGYPVVFFISVALAS
jgi:hypothetical protein